VALAALLCSANPAWGQDVTATITGTVSDPSGAPIVGATVTAKDTDRGTVHTSQTNELGSYNIVRIPVGTYDVKVEMKGFQTSVVSSVTAGLESNRPNRCADEGGTGNADGRGNQRGADPQDGHDRSEHHH